MNEETARKMEFHCGGGYVPVAGSSGRASGDEVTVV
jgi:hypothetical protein